MSFTRRQVIEWAIAGVVGARADAIVVNFWDKFKSAASTVFSAEPPRVTEQLASNIRTVFGADAEQLKIVGGRAHYQYPGTMHPDDRWACRTILDYASAVSRASESAEMPLESGASGNYACAGSPVSNAWTRLFLEYRYIDAAKPSLGLIRNDHPRIKLPFEFALDKRTIRRVAKHSIYEPERRETNWSIKTIGDHYFIPSITDLENDLLLITQMPNWLDLETNKKNGQAQSRFSAERTAQELQPCVTCCRTRSF